MFQRLSSPTASEVASSEVLAIAKVKFAPLAAQVRSNFGANLTSLCEWNEQNFTTNEVSNFTFAKQKLHQFVGTNVSFEQSSKVRFIAVRYNISKGECSHDR